MLVRNSLSKSLIPVLTLSAWLAAGTALAADEDIAINEVFYTGDANTDWAELINTGPDPVDVTGWWWCSRFAYHQINPFDVIGDADLILQPGEIVAFRVIMNMNDSAADLGIYTINNFGDPNAMIDFMQWGSGADIGRTDVAVAKGIWPQFGPNDYGFVPTVSGPGDTAAWCGTNAGGGVLTTGGDFRNGPGSQNGPTVGICPSEVILGNGFETTLRGEK